MVRKYNFNEMAELHKGLSKLCMERLGDDVLTAHKRATWMMQQERIGYASEEDIEKILQKSKTELKKIVVRKGQWFVHKG